MGNARTFLINWALARSRDWSLILRIEDLDTPRVKPGAIRSIFDTFAWLGIDWHQSPIATPSPDLPPGVLLQSADLEPYRRAMRDLAARGLAYPCSLSRQQVELAASAPQEGASESRFPAELRPAIAGTPMDFDQVQHDHLAAHAEPANWRFFCPPGQSHIVDALAGERWFDVSAIVGDFVLWTKRDQPSYQLAVVVDDHRQFVTHVVRGDDLLDSAARQLLLYHALHFTPGSGGAGPPAYTHLPLVIGPDGKRLAKRHGDTRLDTYRAQGVPAEAVIGLISSWSLPGSPRTPMSAQDFADRLDANTLPRSPVTFTDEDHRWLLSFARS